MKVVALISGGKDSTFNMMHCVARGHEIVALANLRPREGVEELDSYMYQSVGHDGIEAIAECMNLPLYRQTITGRPANVEYEYAVTKGDEVEDLYELLKTIKLQHPDVLGVSSGAILSNYQRIRVENICERLGMVSLAFLWNRQQNMLLQAMIDSQVEAILIKVATAGLDKSHVGQTLVQMRDTLFALGEKYRINTCGEGGEFESFTLDCPLYKRRIVLDETELIMHKDDMMAPVVYLKIKKLHTETKEEVDIGLGQASIGRLLLE